MSEKEIKHKPMLLQQLSAMLYDVRTSVTYLDRKDIGESTLEERTAMEIKARQEEFLKRYPFRRFT